MGDKTKETVSFRIERSERLALDALAANGSRKRSELINDAIRSFIDVQRWQIEEIAKAVSEADRGDFVSPGEVKAFFKKHAK